MSLQGSDFINDVKSENCNNMHEIIINRAHLMWFKTQKYYKKHANKLMCPRGEDGEELTCFQEQVIIQWYEDYHHSAKLN